ncbi:hypothetical protein M0802_012182 [Mischocyttarus mexicanus]|nr:hypothetical protein M0802_012182 [Mischocyttarus mexicanus]
MRRWSKKREELEEEEEEKEDDRSDGNNGHWCWLGDGISDIGSGVRVRREFGWFGRDGCGGGEMMVR